MEDSIPKAIQKMDAARADKFLPYLGMAIRNNAIQWLRRQKKSRAYLEEEARALIRRSQRSAFAEVITNEALALFDLAVNRLTRRERRALLMRVVDGLEFHEIGRRMRTNAGCARNAFFRAKERLQIWLRDMKAV